MGSRGREAIFVKTNGGKETAEFAGLCVRDDISWRGLIMDPHYNILHLL